MSIISSAVFFELIDDIIGIGREAFLAAITAIFHRFFTISFFSFSNGPKTELFKFSFIYKGP
jgi:hypothetical protein